MGYRTQKYNNDGRHELDRFENPQEAIKSAKALHNPDWPVWQGIRVLDEDGKVIFDSGK